MRDPALVVIAGPTAVGKTSAAVALARLIPAEIVCADSRVIYRGMDIGTAKPSRADLEQVPHHLLDIAQPDQVVTLAEYQRLAGTAIAGIRGRNRVPLLVGGTGLYIRAVVDGFQIPAAPPDWRLRAALEAEERAGGSGTLHRRLLQIDPEAAGRIHPHNVRRVIRALEVQTRTGTSISMLRRPAAGAGDERPPAQTAPHVQVAHRPPGPVAMIALVADRARLYERIHRRIDQQLAGGLVEEVRGLLAAGYAQTLPALQALGYKELVPYLEGSVSLEEARAMFRRNTRRYAKRQLTWFRGDPRYHWLDVGDDPPEVVAGRIRAMITV
ncbi:MAG: tRNA (adenosine(37)-N6)-dimethylallyltransferase MiaA [Bacillati bacterium ANGP1]|uniref:tRNA dimethylallyltransferase n=1 Tax=Candidatus Segetimicrobium genomatis TaxID=2569760 RepID=A0A537K203_9BACT|nr:MAG: tRNA (adenosine(37)-N6)-dimethylallyltransferase MiaA [Terrabacteria group bacterium ANGP1]